MIIDMHVHLANVETLFADQKTAGRSVSNAYLKRVMRWARIDQPPAGDGEKFNECWRERLANWIRGSSLDKAVLLVLDAAYDEAGERRDEWTILEVENSFVAAFVQSQPEFLFGASIHPYRKDALAELETAVKRGARLVKWIPSGQRIEPDNARCFPFYEAMAHYGVPLLSHTGVEHTLGRKHSALNHPAKLKPALDRGVTVIAAHCGVHLFLYEPSFFKAWCRMACEYEKFHGDTGAFPIVTRVPTLRRILNDSTLRAKLLYGSDFPAIPPAGWCWQLGLKEMRRSARIANPLERNLHMIRALGTSDDVLHNAGRLFHMNCEEESHGH